MWNKWILQDILRNQQARWNQHWSLQRKVAFDENATSADVRKASDMLRAAVQGLEEKSESGTTPDKPESGNQKENPKENPKEQSSVKTGDNNSMIVWLVVAVSMLVVLMERKRKEKR